MTRVVATDPEKPSIASERVPPKFLTVVSPICDPSFPSLQGTVGWSSWNDSGWHMYSLVKSRLLCIERIPVSDRVLRHLMIDQGRVVLESVTKPEADSLSNCTIQMSIAKGMLCNVGLFGTLHAGWRSAATDVVPGTSDVKNIRPLWEKGPNRPGILLSLFTRGPERRTIWLAFPAHTLWE